MHEETYYFTFGHGQKHFPGHVKITVKGLGAAHTGWGVARQAMLEKYGTKWAFQYDSLSEFHAADNIQRNEITVNLTKP